ncbi:MAG: hypothetical protein ACTH4C_00275 [Psychrobacter celer]
MLDKAFKTAIEKTNLQLKGENHIKYDDSQLLMKKGSNVNSLGIAVFIATLEMEVKKETGIKVDLVAKLNEGENVSYFEEVGKLKQYLLREIK